MQTTLLLLPRHAAVAVAGSNTRRSFFSLPFSSPSSSSSSSKKVTSPPKGTLKRQGSLSIYEESRSFPYSQQQLYAIIADVDSYHQFLPFITSSTVSASSLSSSSSSSSSPSTPPLKGKEKEKAWLVGGQEGDKWLMDGELKVGAMGFQESYVSRVEATKWSSVAATAKDTSIFRHLYTKWSLDPLPPSSSSTTKGGTKVSLYLAWAFASPFHAAAVGAVWEKVSGLMVDGFEKRAREVYGIK